MKTTIITLFWLIGYGFSGYSQDSPQRILGSVIYKNQIFNYEFTKETIDSYSFRMSQNLDSINANAPRSDSVPITFFSQFDKEIIVKAFTQQMMARFNLTDTAGLEEKGAEIFFSLQARLDFIDDEPVTAYLILKKNYVHSLLKANGSQHYYRGQLSHLLVNHYIHRLDVETEDGAIKNITAKLVAPQDNETYTLSPRRFLEFKNQFPISISGKFDAEKFSDIDLYCFNCGGVRGLIRHFPLSSILLLDIVLENDKDDYSPSNRVVSVSPGHPISELKKEQRSRIFEISAFSDFQGLNQEEPNGLIQIEARRKINLNTKSRLLFRNKKKQEMASQVNFQNVDYYESERYNKRYTLYRVYLKQQEEDMDTLYRKQSIDSMTSPGITSRKKASGSDNSRSESDTIIEIWVKNKRNSYTFLNILGSLEPKLLFSKIEENNRQIETQQLDNNRIRPLHVMQYQLISFGATLNALRFTFPQPKINWQVINVGYYWVQTRVEGVPQAINNDYLLLGSHFNFRPDNRWGFGFGMDFIKPEIHDPAFSLLNNGGIYQTCFDGFFKTDATSKLFFRFRFLSERDDADYNFAQIQLGYSMNVFASVAKTRNP